jgi:hypothetical protein
MLGQPIAAIALALGMAGEIERVAQRLPGIAALDDRREVEDGERDHDGDMVARRPLPAMEQFAVATS